MQSGADRRRAGERRRSSDAGYAGSERRSGSDRRRPVRIAAGSGGDGAALPRLHRLLPANGVRYLSPLRVVARIESEFAYVEVDEAEGHRHVAAIIERLREDMRRRPHPLPEVEQRLERLQQVKERAVHLRFGDDPGSELEFLCTTVVAGEPLVIECESADHAHATQSLLKRCAKALGYSIIRDRSSEQ